MEVGSCGVLGMSRVYPKTLFGPMFYSWWKCALGWRAKIPDHQLISAYSLERGGEFQLTIKVMLDKI